MEKAGAGMVIGSGIGLKGEKEGMIGGQRVKVLRDTGCSGVVVKKRLVEKGQLTGERKIIARIDNTVVEVPVAKIEVKTPYFSGKVDAMCLEDALYDLVIGNIQGARAPDDPCVEWESKESGRESRPLVGGGGSPFRVPGNEAAGVTLEMLGMMQGEDSTVAKLGRERREKVTAGGRSWFVKEGGVLYRRFERAGANKEKTVRQVVVPQALRRQALALTHESDPIGHLSVKRTLRRARSNFFWPGLRNDAIDYCGARNGGQSVGRRIGAGYEVKF